MSLPLFKDVGKRLSDLITKDFPSEKKETKAEWKSTTPAGVKLEFNIRTEEGRDGPKTVGLIKNEYVYQPYNTTFTAELNTEREFKGEASVQDKLVKSLKNTFTLQSQNKKSGLEYFGIVGLEYRHKNASVTLSTEVGRATDNALKASAVVGHQGVTIGTSAEYLRKDSTTELKELKSSVGYSSDEFDVVAYGKVNQKDLRKTTEVGATYYHKLNSNVAVGTEVKFDVTTKDADKKPTLTFGTQYKVDADTLVKAKFDTEGKLGLSYQLQVNKNTKLTAAATIDSNDPSSKHGTQFGFNLALSG
jgi:hypothetical protein